MTSASAFSQLEEIFISGEYGPTCMLLCVCSGPENPWLVQAYVHAVKHPFASVVGQEVFQSGIIPSDTDFRIFRDFGNIPGICTHKTTHVQDIHSHFICNQFD